MTARADRSGALSPAEPIALWYDMPRLRRIHLNATRIPLWMYGLFAICVAVFVVGGILAMAGGEPGALGDLLAAGACSGFVAVSWAAMKRADDTFSQVGEPKYLEGALLQMGAIHPRLYLRRNPDRVNAHRRLRSELSDRGQEESFRLALVAFCAPDPDAAVTSVPALVRERGVTDHRSLLELLAAEEEAPPAVRSGIL